MHVYGQQVHNVSSGVPKNASDTVLQTLGVW